MSKKRRSDKIKDGEPPKKKAKTSDDDKFAGTAAQIQTLKRRKREAVRKLQLRHETEMRALEEKYDTKIDVLKSKIAPLVEERALCPECHEKCSDKCTNCECLVCTDCMEDEEEVQDRQVLRADRRDQAEWVDDSLRVSRGRARDRTV